MASKYAVLAWPVDLDRTYSLLSAELPKADAEELVRKIQQGAMVCDLLPLEDDGDKSAD